MRYLCCCAPPAPASVLPSMPPDRPSRRRCAVPTDTRLAGYTVADLARRYRVSCDRVRGWIERGELRALSRRDARCGRPAYVVTPEAMAEFERGRAVATLPKPARRKKRTQEMDFYPD